MAFFSSINNISCFASPILTSCTLSNRVWVGEWGCLSELQNTAKIISTVKLQSWSPPPLQIKDRKMACFGFRRASSLNFLFGGSGGGEEGGGGEGERDGNLLLHDLLPSREGGCFLGVGIALLLHFPVFYRILL